MARSAAGDENPNPLHVGIRSSGVPPPIPNTNGAMRSEIGVAQGAVKRFRNFGTSGAASATRSRCGIDMITATMTLPGNTEWLGRPCPVTRLQKVNP